MAAGAAALILTATLQAAPAAQADEVAHAAGFTANLTWSTTLNDAGNPIALSSPNVANLDGQPAVVVGDRAGKVYAYHLSDGIGRRRLALQRRRSRRLLAVGRPHLAQRHRLGLRRQRRHDGDPTAGGYQAITNTGGDQWFVQETNPGTDPTPHSGVAASLTVGSYAGGYGVEAGSLGPEHLRAGRRQRRHARRLPVVPGRLGVLDGRGRRPLRRRQQRARSAVATPAPAWPTGRPTPTAGTSASSRARATPGSPTPNGGLICQYNTNQNIDRSSPAVGQFLGGGAVGIAIGDGSFYSGASDSNKVFAINTGCGLAWSDQLNGVTADSPALANVTGNGQLDVVEGTAGGHRSTC